jgi:hypothetical protein
MSNHYHVVLRVDRDAVTGWSDEEVMERWTRLFRGPLLVQRQLAGETLTAPERATVTDIAAVWRTRLYNVSWFMRCLNETIARRANVEDACTGRFWEGRFKSQALLDDVAVLSCMAYVDLNPIRAGIASSLKDSDFTSIRERLEDLAAASPGEVSALKEPPGKQSELFPFSSGGQCRTSPQHIPVAIRDYIALVEATGHFASSDKRGYISEDARSILDGLGLNNEQWFELALEVPGTSFQAIGALPRLQRYATASGRKWIGGVRRLERIFSSA